MKRHDLTGTVFGHLTVLGLDGSGLWTTVCSCGATENIPRARLTTRARCWTSCARCRSASCDVCGGLFAIRKGGQRTCSDVCHLEKVRRIARESASRRLEDPAFRASKNALARARRSDPSSRLMVLASDRRQQKARADNPMKRAADLNRKKLWYERRRKTIKANRRSAFDVLSLEAKEVVMQRRRAAARRFAEKLRVMRRINPKLAAKNILYNQQLRRRRRLSTVLSAASKMLEQLELKNGAIEAKEITAAVQASSCKDQVNAVPK